MSLEWLEIEALTNILTSRSQKECGRVLLFECAMCLLYSLSDLFTVPSVYRGV